MPPEPSSEETLFARALALPEAERLAFVEQVCSGDTALQTSIEALLRAHAAANSFLSVGTDVADSSTETALRAEEKPGDWIGRYKLMQKIGEGGCGVVYMAEQEEPVRRRVALKVIKLGMDTREVIARFDAERQALAMMDHQNIARVFDAGTTPLGRPYFVMELVRGIPVTKFCDENDLSTEKRLGLFAQVCHAIQHAHQKGIIHRDIKPSNILVTLHDGVPVPKVIDFGIAKATQGKLTDHTYFTAFEQFIGTPAYTSPEQAEMSGLDIDTRSDVYSLGVLLYELVTGRPPFDPKTFLTAGLHEMRRLIREVDPPKPSSRLFALNETDRTTVARQRGTVPAQLSMVLSGDLDWIVMRCLEKNRTRRYATPSELAADIQRFLRNEPVIARPPSSGYLLRKIIRRHKVGFAAGTAIAVSLIGGLIVSSVLLVREHAARERAVVAEATESRLRREAEQAGALEAELRAIADVNASQARIAAAKSTQVARFMKDMLDGVGPSVALGRDTKLLREILDTTARRLDTELKDHPEVAADLRDTLGTVYIDLGQYAAAEPMLHTAVQTHRAEFGNQSAETAGSLYLWGRALRHLNKSDEADAALQEALRIRHQLFGSEHPLVADTLIELAWVPNPHRSRADMQAMLEEALAIRRKVYVDAHPDVAAAIYELGRAAQKEVEHAAAARLHEEALAMRRRLLGNDHPDVAASLDALGYSYGHELDLHADAAAAYGESFAIRRKVLGDAHPAMVVSLLRFTGQGAARDIPAETMAIAREFVANQRKLLPRDSALLGPSLLALASLEGTPDRDAAEAQALVKEGLRILEQSRASGSPLDAEVINAMFFFAWSKVIANVPSEGLAMGEETMRQAQAAFGANGAGTMLPAHTLAWLYFGLGRQDEAVSLIETAMPLLRARLGEDFPITLVDVAALGAGYCRTNRVAEAHQFLVAALASIEANSGAAGPNPHVAIVQGQLGLTLLREDRPAEAEAMLRQALKGYEQHQLKPLPLRLHPRQRVASGLGQALVAQGKFAEAEPMVVQAFRELQANQHRLAGNPSAMVRDALDAVVSLYLTWAETDPEKLPTAAKWRVMLEEFDTTQLQRGDLSSSKI